MGKVVVLSSNLYSQWRRPLCRDEALREPGHLPFLTEQLLQSVWHHQRLLRDQLHCLDGQAIRVLHPGFWNQEAGPDFRGAVVQFGSGEVVTGDVELDIHPHGWKGHRHDRNPAYGQVILHVVWNGGSGDAAIPTLPLEPFLDAPLSELAEWLGRDPLKHWVGQCSGPLGQLPEDQLRELLQQAAAIRLRAKAAQFEARARQVGLDQSLWEGLFGALGYKHNVWPMRRVAELLPALSPSREPSGALTWQSLLFGIAGMLPNDLPRYRAKAREHVRALWDVWWRERDRFVDCVVPRVLWRFNGCRPANHPERRLALAAHWLASGNILSQLEKWISDSITPARLLPSLMEALNVPGDEFWSWHWTFRSPRLPRAQPLLGAQRATDLAINVILPSFWMRAASGKNDSLQRAIEGRYFGWPKAEDNATLRLTRQRLFAGKECRFIKTAAHQQALLQIVRDFCDQSNSLCDQCRFPNLVRHHTSLHR